MARHPLAHGGRRAVDALVRSRGERGTDRRDARPARHRRRGGPEGARDAGGCVPRSDGARGRHGRRPHVIRDVWTVVWKEWQEFRDQLLSLRRGGLSALILALVLGIVAPVQLGPDWVQSRIIVAYWPFLAATMVSSLIADSVAGERERHTLETLLASRLSDSAIVIGKIIAAVLYGLGFAVANLVLGLIAVNIAHPESAPILFGAQRLAATIVLTILASLLMAGIGVFISLRASTVKQAQQAFGIAIIVLTMGPLLAFNALSPELRFRLATRVGALGETKIEAYAVAILTLLSVLVIAGALARFRRGKLVLD